LTPFFETLGKPLSIAINARFKGNGKLKEAYYFVGNDDARTIDAYYEKNDQFYLVGQYPVGDNGIQALDMVFDRNQNQLFVVDGLAREVKVLQPDGQLVRSFGAGVLSDPKGIAIDFLAGEIYVSDYGDPVVYPVIPASIEVFDMTGSHLSGRKISGSGIFSRPQGLTLLGDKVYLADNMLAQILEFDRATGAKTASFGCRGSSDEHLLLPMDVVTGDSSQQLFVADNRNMRVTVLPLTQP
jgi:DNA-binding beta-propeller fold protein YncE